MTDTSTTPTETDAEAEASQALELAVKGVLDKVNKGAISWKDLIQAIAPPAPIIKVGDKLPMPAAITEKERKALAHILEVFGKVVPTERRALEPTELTTLLDERQTLTVIAKMAETRKEDIRTTVLNHCDLLFEAIPDEEKPQGVIRDEDGHYVIARRVEVPDASTKFSAEVTKGSATLDPGKLEALAKDPEYADLTWEEYLACTTQVRIFDEAKATMLLRKKPHIIKAIRTATSQSNPRLTFTER